MKLIVTGATGFVGSEVIRQALRNPAITSVIALTRRPVSPPDNPGSNIDISKFQSVILSDWTNAYPPEVKEHLQDADACIWTLAVTPSASKDLPFEDVTKICFDYTMNGLSNMASIARKPFRFIYTSGVLIERDQSKSNLMFLTEYRLMRGRVENAVLDFAKQHEPDVQVTVTKPGAIDGPNRGAIMEAMVKMLLKMFSQSHIIHVSELAAAMIDQCENGITKDPLWSSDLVQISKGILNKEDYLV